jgi:hypothetical protein
MRRIQRAVESFGMGLCLLVVVSIASIQAAVPAAASGKRPWTFLVYLAAANTLSEFAGIDINEMIKVGSNNNVNIIVYLTVFNTDNSKITQRLYIEKGKAVPIGATTSEDSGSVETLMKSLHWMCTDYPADHYCVVLWNHGGGVLNRSRDLVSRSICYDDSTGHYLTDRTCLQAFNWAKNSLNGGKNIDVVATDACLMSMIEFAYALAPCTDYFVGSESTIPGDGYEYARILNTFVRGVPSASSLAKTMVRVYQQVYATTPDCTLSAINQALLAPLVNNVNQVASLLSSALGNSTGDSVSSAITTACQGVTTFTEGDYMDLAGFYTSLAAQVPTMDLSSQQVSTLQGLLAQGTSLINNCVIAKMTSTSYKTLGGISFYFPQQSIDPSYYKLYWAEHNPAMVNLIEQYVNAAA